MPLKVLLLQARKRNDPMIVHEHRCFVTQTGLAEDRIVPHDLVGDGPPTILQARRFDALMVGGSGDFSVAKGDLPKFEYFAEFLQEIVARQRPLFASCFGYHSIVHALDGEVVTDLPNMEVGTFSLELADEAQEDPLFCQMPANFEAQMGHKDRATRHPVGLTNLASSERCPLQALRLPNAPIWATQFHPELDRKSNQERYEAYSEAYAPHVAEEEREDPSKRFRDSDEASALLKRFIALVFE